MKRFFKIISPLLAVMIFLSSCAFNSSEKTLEQINELAAAGCEIVRLAVLNKDAADSINSCTCIGFNKNIVPNSVL